MSDDEIEIARGRVVDAILKGEEPREEDGAIAADVALAYIESCRERGRERVARKVSITNDKDKRKRLLDLIMEHSYSGEDLRMSLSRVSKAVAVIGFPVVTAFTAWCAYRIFPELEKEEYHGRRRKEGSRRSGRAR